MSAAGSKQQKHGNGMNGFVVFNFTSHANQICPISPSIRVRTAGLSHSVHAFVENQLSYVSNRQLQNEESQFKARGKSCHFKSPDLVSSDF